MSEITAIVASHNEASTIRKVLLSLVESDLFSQIIVVDDGTDSTKSIVKSMSRLNNKIKLFHLKKRAGKGRAIRFALRSVNTEFTFLCDADLIGLESQRIRAIVFPVINGNADMCVGLKDKKSGIARILMKTVLPLIGGERAMRTKHLKAAIKNPLANYYGLEIVLNHYFRKKGLRIKKVFMKGVNDRIKPRKWQLKRGTYDLARETLDLLMTYAALYGGDKNAYGRTRKMIELMYRRK